MLSSAITHHSGTTIGGSRTRFWGQGQLASSVWQKRTGKAVLKDRSVRIGGRAASYSFVVGIDAAAIDSIVRMRVASLILAGLLGPAVAWRAVSKTQWDW